MHGIYFSRVFAHRLFFLAGVTKMPPSVPSPEDVTAYLAAHSLETVIEDAVNDAVLKQVKNPYKHIADILLKKGGDGDGASSSPSKGARVNLDHTPGKASFATEVVTTIKDSESSGTIGEEKLTREYVVKADVKLSDALHDKLRAFFDKMDTDKNGEVSKDEAIAFWGKNFAKVNANSMFNEVDEDGNSSITWDEFLKFWQNVVASGYAEEDVLEEVDMMLEGGSWVDFNDGRTT